MIAKGFNFSSEQGDTGFEGFEDFEVESRTAIGNEITTLAHNCSLGLLLDRLYPRRIYHVNFSEDKALDISAWSSYVYSLKQGNNYEVCDCDPRV